MADGLAVAHDDETKRTFDDSVITPATARRFTNGFFLGHL